MSDSSAAERWAADRTTFQRVYDVVVGTRAFSTAADIAERAACSETGARKAVEQLVEMGVATRREGRPATYRRNDSYLRWKRVESLASEHGAEELRERLAELVAEDERFRERYGVPTPDAISTADLGVDEHDTLEERWADLREWRTVRRDADVLRRAVERAESGVDDGVRV